MSADELVAAPELKAAASEATAATTPLLLLFFFLTSNIDSEDIALPPPAKKVAVRAKGTCVSDTPRTGRGRTSRFAQPILFRPRSLLCNAVAYVPTTGERKFGAIVGLLAFSLLQ